MFTDLVYMDTRSVSTGRPTLPSGHHLSTLTHRPHWVAHRKKRPINPSTRKLASPTDPLTWGTFDAARALAAAGHADGIGYVITADTPEMCIDLDKCVDAVTGTVESWAMEVVESFGSYTELSPSGTGLHIWIRGTIPGDRNRSGHIEMYDRGRYMTVTFNPLPGYDIPIRDAQDELSTFYARTFPAPVALPVATGPVLTLEDQDIIDALMRESDGAGKAVPLLAGDFSNYPSPSEARAALAWKCCFYTDSADQVARILLRSGLFKSADKEQERERKARQDATAAVTNYVGPRYSGGRRVSLSPAPATAAAVDHADLATKSHEELRALILEQTALIEAERAARLAAEARADRLAKERSAIFTIMRNGDLGAERLTAFALALDMHARIANGEKPTEHGYKTPAARYAENTGQSVDTVQRHLRSLSKKGLIEKRVVREQTEREYEGESINQETGEIQTERETIRGVRDVNYLVVPENNVINLVDRLATYQRPEGETGHGGKRDARPACPNHPEAGTYSVRSQHIECAECHEVLERTEISRTYYSPEGDEESSGGILPSPSNCNHSSRGEGHDAEFSDGIMQPEDGLPSDAGSDGIMQPEPANLERLTPCVDCGTMTTNVYRCDGCIEQARILAGASLEVSA